MTCFERFEVYGIGVYYPRDWSVEVKKLKREEGEVNFRSREGHYLTLLWAPLDSTLKKHDNIDDYVEDLLQNIAKSKHIKKFQLLSRETVNINGHKAFVMHLRLSIGYGGLLARSYLEQDVWIVNLFCDNTNRFMVMYSIGKLENEEDNERTFKRALDGLKCH